MEKALDQRITTKLSLAVSLMDDFTAREEVAGGVKVSIPALKLEAIKNPSGYYNFLDISDDTYTIQIKSDYYLDEKIDISLPFYTIRNPLRFDHVSGTPIKKMTPSSTTSARTADPCPSAGDIFIFLTNITDPINIDDVFRIEDSDLSHIEFCQIESPLPSDPAAEPYYLTLPLRFNYTAAAPLRKMLPEPVTAAEIDGGAFGAEARDMSVSLTNLTDVINVKDVFEIEDVNTEFCQIVAPLIKITVKPNSLYPFPSGTTLIRGVVKDLAGNPISGAVIEVIGDRLNTRTSDTGQLALYFPATQEDSAIQLNVTPQGDPPKTVEGEVRKGMTAPLSITYP